MPRAGRPPDVTVLELTLLLWTASLVAGLVGALSGLGGGVVIVPLLVIAFGVDIRYAVGASLVSAIATSSGAAAAYVREGYSNLRVGMFLEVATTLGALAGALVAPHVPATAIAVLFALVLLYSALWPGRARPEAPDDAAPDKLASRLRMASTYPTSSGPKAYNVRHVPAGFGLMALAGLLSALLGIGSGSVKVLAMDRAMGLPFKVSSTTSNFMIGVTAAASAGIYLRRGHIDPGLAMPVVLGVLPGALLGARLLARASSRLLRQLFAGVLILLAVEMLWSAVTGRV